MIIHNKQWALTQASKRYPAHKTWRKQSSGIAFSQIAIIISYLLLATQNSVASSTASTSALNPTNTVKQIVATPQLTTKPVGIYQVKGVDPQFGAYQGWLEIRPDTTTKNQSFAFTRIVDYADYRFNSLVVEQVWTGVMDVSSASAHVVLKAADFIRRFENVSRTDADRKPVDLTLKFLPLSPNSPDSFVLDGPTSHDVATRVADFGKTPLYDDDVTLVSANKKLSWFWKKLTDWLFKKYRDDAFVRQYRDRADFQNGVHFFYRDRTDFDFYRNNPNMIRVTNKPIDLISLNESLLRKNAFGPTLLEKAKYYDANTKQKHINSTGVVVPVQVDHDGNVISEVEDGDAALWTGTYVATQAFRYKVTQDPEALANLKKSLTALLIMTKITGDTQTFARALKAYNPKETIPSEWHRGSGEYANIIYKEGGNNDMFKGFAYAFITAHMALPEGEKELRKQMLEACYKLETVPSVRGRATNYGKVLGLINILNNKSAAYYTEAYDENIKNGEYTFNIPLFIGIADWSGNHLAAVGGITDLLIAQGLRTYPRFERILKDNNINTWEPFRNANQHLFSILVKGSSGDRIQPQDQAKFRSSFVDAIWGLREIPAPRPRFDGEIDHSISSDWSVSPFPRLPWKFLVKKDLPASFGYQGLFGMPLFELAAINDNYLWKSEALKFKTQVDPNIEYSGVDYLHGYWMARYYKLITPSKEIAF